jgi:hypothetical protein
MLDLWMGAPPCLLPAPCTFAAGDNDCLAESIGGGGGERSLSIMRADKYVNCAVLACPCAGASSGGVSAFAVGATAACALAASPGSPSGAPTNPTLPGLTSYASDILHIASVSGQLWRCRGCPCASCLRPAFANSQSIWFVLLRTGERQNSLCQLNQHATNS